MTTTPPTPAGIDRACTEDTLYRVAIAAFQYYPGKPWEEPGYTVAEDVDWCLQPLAALPPALLQDLRPTLELLITTPTANRRPFIRYLDGLADGAGDMGE